MNIHNQVPINETSDGVSFYLLILLALAVSFALLVTNLLEIVPFFILAIPVFAVVFAALGVCWSGSFVISVLLGMLPAYGWATGIVLVRPTVTPLTRNLVHANLLVTRFALPVATIGFIIGTGIRYRDQLHDRLPWLLLRIAIAVAITLLLVAAEQYNILQYGSQATP